MNLTILGPSYLILKNIALAFLPGTLSTMFPVWLFTYFDARVFWRYQKGRVFAFLVLTSCYLWLSLRLDLRITVSIFLTFREILLRLRIQWRIVFGNVIRCSRLRLWVGYFIYLKFTSALFSMGIFNGSSLVPF